METISEAAITQRGWNKMARDKMLGTNPIFSC